MSQVKCCLLREDTPDHHTQISLCLPHVVLSHIFSSSYHQQLYPAAYLGFCVTLPVGSMFQDSRDLAVGSPTPSGPWRQELGC